MKIKKTLKTIGDYLFNPYANLEKTYEALQDFYMYIVPNALVNEQRKTVVLKSKIGLNLALLAESPLPIGFLKVSGTRLRKQYSSDTEFYDSIQQVVEGKKSKEKCLKALESFASENKLFIRSQEFVGVVRQPRTQKEKSSYY